MATGLLGHVVIPAHDEAGGIAACLSNLLRDSAPGELDVTVVCNGCRDDTAGAARRAASELGHDVTVLELPEAGKARALRAAEELRPGYPRLYLDADVVCSSATARSLLRAVQAGWDVAVPSRVLDLAGCGPLARRYYATWAELPWVREQLAGRGAYAVGDALREVLATLPEVVAEDRLVTASVPRDRATVVAEPVTVAPPARVADIVRVRSRVYSGNVLVQAPTHDRGAAHRVGGLLRLGLRPTRWPGLLVFVAVSGLAKVRAAAAVRRGSTTWERDPRRVTA